MTWAAALGGLATLFVMAPRQRSYAYILLAILGCSAPYIVVQPILRYRYMISALLIFCALDGAFRLNAYIRTNLRPELRRGQRSSDSRQPTADEGAKLA